MLRTANLNEEAQKKILVWQVFQYLECSPTRGVVSAAVTRRFCDAFQEQMEHAHFWDFPSPSQLLNCVNCANCVILFPDILQYWQGCLNILGNCRSLWWGDVGNHRDCGGPLICLARSGWIQRGCGTGSNTRFDRDRVWSKPNIQASQVGQVGQVSQVSYVS